jgi:hypothetical protein
MSTLVAFADANGIIDFASVCPPHGLGFASGPDKIVRKVVTEQADIAGARALKIPNFATGGNDVAALIAFGARVRTGIAAAQAAATKVMPPKLTLDDRRRLAAQQRFEDFDFGSQVGEAQGWEYATPGHVWERQVYVEQASGPSSRRLFVVAFKPDSDEILSADVYPIG